MNLCKAPRVRALRGILLTLAKNVSIDLVLINLKERTDLVSPPTRKKRPRFPGWSTWLSGNLTQNLLFLKSELVEKLISVKVIIKVI